MIPEIALALMAATLGQGSANSVSGVVEQLRSKNYSAAVKLADEELRAHPGDPRLWTLKGMALSGEYPSHPEKALPTFEKAIEIAPAYLPALEAAAQAEYAIGDPRARAHLEKILSLRSGDPTASAMMAVLDFRSADFAASAKYFKASEQLIANQPEPLLEYASSLANSGQLSDAVPVFERIVQLQPENHSAVYNLALVNFRLHKTSEALTVLQPLLSLPDANEEVLTLGAEMNEALGQTQPALDLLHRAILLHPKDAEAYLYLAHLSFAHSSVQVGIDILDAGIRQIPAEPRLYVARGILLSQLGKNDLAFSDFDKAGALDPKLSTTQTARGIAQSQEHKNDQALATFREAARLHPNDALTHYLLAEALSNDNPPSQSAEGKEELEAALRAVKLDSQMKSAHDLIATIYLRQEKFSEAAEHSDAALKIDPNDQEAIYHLILAARKGVNKDQLPALLKRFAAARQAKPDSVENPHGYLVESK